MKLQFCEDSYNCLLQFGRGQQQRAMQSLCRPCPSMGWGGEWKEKGKKLVGRDKGSLTKQQMK